MQSIQQPGQDCLRRRDVLKFWSYILTRRNTSSANLDGFIPLSPHLSEVVMNKLRTMTCDGFSLLQSEHLFSNTNSCS